MNALTTASTFCPSSFQLKLALCRRKYPFSIVHTRSPELDRRRLSRVVVVRSSSVNGGGRSSGWIKSKSSDESFAGWSNAEPESESDEANSKQSLLGIIGAGVAGVVLVAGLTCAALSISNRSTSKVKQDMEPLTTDQEESLSYDKHQDGDVVEKSDEKHLEVLDIGSEESKTGTSEDLSLDKENIEAIENKNSDDSDVRQLSEDGYVSRNGIQNAPQNESTIINSSFSPGDSEKLSTSNITNIDSENLNVPGVQNIDSENPDVPEVETLFDAEPLDPSKSEVDANAAEALIAGTADGISSREIPNLPVDDPIVEASPLEVVLDTAMGSKFIHEEFTESMSRLPTDDFESHKELQTVLISQTKDVVVSLNGDDASPETENVTGTSSSGAPPVLDALYQAENGNSYNDDNIRRTFFDLNSHGNVFTSVGVPAPSLVSAALQSTPGKVLIPAAVDQLQSQALSALQVLKVIEDDVRPGDLCSRREYARWLVSASSVLSRNTHSKVYPAMYIENISDLAFDDITPDDPDFSSIQGLAEAGLIASKLSRRDLQSIDEDLSPYFFSPESPLSRQDLVSWRMALEKKQIPAVDRKTLQQISGFIDTDKIDPDAWPALVADLAAGEQGIITLAFGYTRLFQPDKPVTKAQAAIALSTGDASAMVIEELARIEAESMAEKAVAAHNALVSQVEKDLNASYEKELLLEKEKIDAVQKLAEEAKREVQRLRAEREEENIRLMKERAAVDSEMELLSRLRREMEGQLQSLMTDKLEISYEKERMNKLRRDAETENQEISRLQYELEVERKALSMARTWAEDEAKRARDQAKALEEARDRWERRGLKIVVDEDLREEEDAGMTWGAAGSQPEEIVERSESLVDKLKAMASEVTGKCKDTINNIIAKIVLLVAMFKQKIVELKDTYKSHLDSSLQGVQQSSAEFTMAAKENMKRVAGDWKDGVERLSQRFKT